MSIATPQDALYRIDKFVVPAASLGEFAALVGRTHGILQRQDGFVRDLVLEQVSGPGVFNVVTLVEWAEHRSYQAAVETITRFHQEIGFDRSATVKRLGVEADIGLYRESSRVDPNP